MLKKKIVVVDDDAEMRSLLFDFLRGQGFEVECFPLATLALDALQTERPDLIISDIRMPELDGIQFIKQVKRSYPELPVILITAFGSVETAIRALRSGAYDYVVKPFKLTEMGSTVSKALEFRALQRTAIQNRKNWNFQGLIGRSPAIHDLVELVKRISHANANILITGESGTGKEVVAQAIHRNGPRGKKPFVAVNCAAIPNNLLESELFGHAKGAFTGAVQRKTGLFEQADGGTIFLDEIGDMDPSLQVKLLRVIQERKVRPVGDTSSRSIDVNIISATHRNLREEVREGEFRDDLYYRLSVIPVHIPPLRERKEDVELLANFFLEKFSRGSKRFSREALARLREQNWEGNVRELQNLVERLSILTKSETISTEDLQLEDSPLERPQNGPFYSEATSDLPTLQELEKRYIQFVMKKTAGKKSKAARILGINRRTLYRKELEYDHSSGAPEA